MQTRTFTTFLAFALFLAGLLGWSPQAPASGWPTTSADFALLPSYCLYRQRKDEYPAQYQKWERILGHDGWIHIHHYCYGIFSLYNARSTMDPKERKRLLLTAMKQWAYVDKNWPANFKLRPELYVKRGETLLELRNPAAALSEFQKAITIKPDYSLPYARLADYYQDRGETEEAIQWVKKGLKHAPRSKKLKRRLRALENSQAQ